MLRTLRHIITASPIAPHLHALIHRLSHPPPTPLLQPCASSAEGHVHLSLLCKHSCANVLSSFKTQLRTGQSLKTQPLESAMQMLAPLEAWQLKNGARPMAVRRPSFNFVLSSYVTGKLFLQLYTTARTRDAPRNPS